MFTAKAADGQALFPVKKAFSCLYQPLVGDQVLISGCLHDGFYILAIIERPELEQGEQETVLDLGEHVRISAEQLKIEVNQAHIHSAEWIHQAETYGLNVEEFKLGAQNYQLSAQAYEVNAQAYEVSAEAYEVSSTKVTYRGQNMHYYAAQLDENYGQAQRFVAGSDKVHALNFEYRADQMARIHGNNTFINGEKLLKSDGQLMMVG